jgi:hypothetical protein
MKWERWMWTGFVWRSVRISVCNGICFQWIGKTLHCNKLVTFQEGFYSMEVAKEEFALYRLKWHFSPKNTNCSLHAKQSVFFITAKLYKELILTDRSNTANWPMFCWLPKTSENVLKRRVHFKNTRRLPNVLNSSILCYCLYPSSLYIMLAGRINRRECNWIE